MHFSQGSKHVAVAGETMQSGQALSAGQMDRLMEAFGGEIRYETAAPGARFTIKLPAS